MVNLASCTLFFGQVILPAVLAAQAPDNFRGSTSTARPEERRVWMTLLTGTSYNSTQLAATQIESVRRCSEYKHVTMVLPAVDGKTREYLQTLPTELLDVPPIYPPYDVSIAWWKDVFAKFNIFNLTEFDQIAYLDADAFLMKEGADKIFDLCDSSFCGVEDGAEINEGTPEAKAMMNAGVLVARPSVERFEFIVEKALPASAEYLLPEQGFLTELFLDRIHGEGAGDFKFLSWEYNTCSKSWYQSCVFNGTECQEDMREQVHIFHHCGHDKLHNYPLCGWDNNEELEEEGPKYSRCQDKELGVFQELLLEVNPCAHGGTGEEQCNAMGEQSTWCGKDIRCITSNTVASCSLTSKDTRATLSRRLFESTWGACIGGSGSCYSPAGSESFSPMDCDGAGPPFDDTSEAPSAMPSRMPSPSRSTTQSASPTPKKSYFYPYQYYDPYHPDSTYYWAYYGPYTPHDGGYYHGGASAGYSGKKLGAESSGKGKKSGNKKSDKYDYDVGGGYQDNLFNHG